MIECADCKAEVERPAGRIGAPPKRCEECAHRRQLERSRAANKRLQADPDRYELAKESARLRSRSKTPAAKRKAMLWSNYRLTVEQFEQMVDDQDGLCAACGQSPEGRGKVPYLVVDHCHDTGRVRGLLCGNCNSALGLMHDSADYLRGLIRYAVERC